MKDVLIAIFAALLTVLLFPLVVIGIYLITRNKEYLRNIEEYEKISSFNDCPQ
jgi:hypothetical protein